MLAALLLGWRSYTPPPPVAVPVVMKMIPLQPETEPEVPLPPLPPEEPVPQPEPRDAPVPPVAPPSPIQIISAPAVPTVIAPPPVPDRNPTASPPPAPVPPPQPASLPPANLAPESWEGRVLARLIRFRRYPPAAHRARIEGVPLVRFTMDRRGRVLDSRLERTSGNALLDREAMSLPQRAQPMPAPPEDRQGKTITLVVPVEFVLR
ncbi:energy transducer TonB family protein [Sphingomonas sp. 2R-10]|uniref:energy transducer TonB family protein n=1 Tax=Sphingomonas sp. 2R-10 TaxID=3045148 RepID=UPI0024B8FCFA|nr:energy transducer TonB [Sphingomonas sp. 2R-10]